jgi:hypothetical protein
MWLRFRRISRLTLLAEPLNQVSRGNIGAKQMSTAAGNLINSPRTSYIPISNPAMRYAVAASEVYFALP